MCTIFTDPLLQVKMKLDLSLTDTMRNSEVVNYVETTSSYKIEDSDYSSVYKINNDKLISQRIIAARIKFLICFLTDIYLMKTNYINYKVS